jgi:translation initiation factor 4B
VEERRQLAIRQKKEADDKVKAEKAEKQKTAKEEKSTTAVDHNGKDVLETPKGGGNFEILRRSGEDESGMSADKEPEEAAPVEAEKETTNGNWRAPAGEAAAAGDDEGWSTVTVGKQRNARRGQTGRGFA